LSEEELARAFLGEEFVDGGAFGGGIFRV